jgi:hypothetical protein
MLWANQSVLSLIWWEDESQLIDQENFEEESGSWIGPQERLGLTKRTRNTGQYCAVLKRD